MSEAEAMVAAAQAGDARQVEELLAGDPALAGARGADGFSALTHAAYRGHSEVIEALLRAGAPLDLFEAATVGNLEAVRERLKTGSELGSFSPDGWTPLHLAAFFGHAALVVELLALGADHALVSRNGMAVTPLQSALARRQVECAGVLLDSGADVNGEPGMNWSPLHYCAANGMPDIAKRLLAMGADVHRRNVEGQTALELAELNGNGEVAGLIAGR
jgi:uncharacterized protein